MDKKNVICEYLGGSHLYGLNTPESDEDVRGVFVNSDPAFILGTKRFDEERNQDPKLKIDIVYKEVSHFMRLLKMANSEALETIFAEDCNFSFIDRRFKLIQEARNELVSSDKLFNCLRGYMQGEYRLAIGERKGQIGGKRYAKLLEVGFSPKNMVQLFRLAYVGEVFFTENRFPVSIRKEPIWEFLIDVKTRPEKYSKEELTELYHKAEVRLVSSYEGRSLDRKFNEDVANEILLTLYRPYVVKNGR